MLSSRPHSADAPKKTILITDRNLIHRIHQVQRRRGDATITKTARGLLHERLLDIDRHGDPSAMPEDQREEAAAKVA